MPLLKPDTRYIFFAVELVPTRSGAGTVEAWAHCERVENGDNTSFILNPLINRSRALAYIQYTADSAGLGLRGCGLAFKVAGAKRAGYTITLSLITPYLRLTGDRNPQAFLEGERGRLARASEDGGFKLNGKPVVAAELAA